MDNVFHLGGRLYQQYIVDMFAKVQQERLNYIKFNQAKMRVDQYNCYVDNMLNREDMGRVGRKVILPSSFTGGARYMNQSYHDAIAMVQKFGKPDLFITMTCNPHWPEITAQLLPHQKAEDRPDIVSRVFKLKKDQLLDDLKKGKLGALRAQVHTIEFQKRGLPHVHILAILKEESKPRPDMYDDWVSAELPDKDTQPELYELVSTHMMHGPCNERCTKDGECAKNFPKAFCEETVHSEDGFPEYKRPNNGRNVTKRGRGILHIFLTTDM